MEVGLVEIVGRSMDFVVGLVVGCYIGCNRMFDNFVGVVVGMVQEFELVECNIDFVVG
jgi:hypothetical protein